MPVVGQHELKRFAKTRVPEELIGAVAAVQVGGAHSAEAAMVAVLGGAGRVVRGQVVE